MPILNHDEASTLRDGGYGLPGCREPADSPALPTLPLPCRQVDATVRQWFEIDHVIQAPGFKNNGTKKRWKINNNGTATIRRFLLFLVSLILILATNVWQGQDSQ